MKQATALQTDNEEEVIASELAEFIVKHSKALSAECLEAWRIDTASKLSDLLENAYLIRQRRLSREYNEP